MGRREVLTLYDISVSLRSLPLSLVYVSALRLPHPSQIEFIMFVSNGSCLSRRLSFCLPLSCPSCTLSESGVSEGAGGESGYVTKVVS